MRSCGVMCFRVKFYDEGKQETALQEKASVTCNLSARALLHVIYFYRKPFQVCARLFFTSPPLLCKARASKSCCLGLNRSTQPNA